MNAREGQTSLFSNMPAMGELLELNHKLCDIHSAMNVLEWDQETYMPKGGAEARGNQLATLAGIYHEVLTSPEAGGLINDLFYYMMGCDVVQFGIPVSFSVYDKALIREIHRAYYRKVKVPTKLVEDISRTTSQAIELWQKARKESNFRIFSGVLKTLLDLKLEEADRVGFEGTPYNLFLDDHEPGLTVETVDRVFASLKQITSAVLAKIQQSDVQIDQDILKKRLPETQFMEFTNRILAAMGFDFDCGRQDKSAHPFTVSFDPSDVRVTTRFGEQYFTSSIYSSIHEGGHALYDQGVDRRLSRTLLGPNEISVSLGIHESQSRLWENCIGRSPEFWHRWYPELLLVFGYRIGALLFKNEDFLKAINKVEPNLIRVDSDEVTYNLHIILRYEIERELVDGRIKVEDLPEAWNAKVKQYLGLDVPNDAKGVLQDVHWSHGSFGYFPTYSLGNLYAAQIFHTLKEVFPDFNERVAAGEMKFAREWLRDKLHKYGTTYRAHELIKMMTGRELDPRYFLEYLAAKFGKIYNFDPAELSSIPLALQ